MEDPITRSHSSPPARFDRIAAALVVLLLLVSLARSVVRRPPAAPPAAATPAGDVSKSTGAADAAGRAPPPTRVGPRLRFEIQAEVAVKESGPPIQLRLRSKSGAQRTFDVTTRAEPARTRMAIEVDLPIEQPELPLRGELATAGWCIPPGLLEFEVARLDLPCSLVVARAQEFEVEVRSEEGRPLPQVRIVHESGRPLATTSADGRARLVRPIRAARDAIVALADGFAPALVEAGGEPAVLRRASAMGLVRGVVRAADGTAVAGASIEPRWFPGGAPPGDARSPADAAARGLFRLAERTRERPLPALALTSGTGGDFEMALPFGGRLILTATQRDLGRCSSTLDLAEEAAAAGHVTEARLDFPRRIALAIVVTLDGAPASRCVVEAVAKGTDETTLLAAATCDAKGAAALAVPDLPPLFLVLRADGAAPRVLEFDAKGRTSVATAESLERGRALRLTLADGDGLEAAGALVAARDGASRVVLATATADAKGNVRFARLPSARTFDLVLPVLGADAPPLATGLLLEKAAAAAGEVDLGRVAMKGR